MCMHMPTSTYDALRNGTATPSEELEWGWAREFYGLPVPEGLELKLMEKPEWSDFVYQPTRPVVAVERFRGVVIAHVYEDDGVFVGV